MPEAKRRSSREYHEAILRDSLQMTMVLARAAKESGYAVDIVIGPNLDGDPTIHKVAVSLR